MVNQSKNKLTGIDDAEKSMNLELKEDAKKGGFGSNRWVGTTKRDADR
jgi:hypothetical protein